MEPAGYRRERRREGHDRPGRRRAAMEPAGYRRERVREEAQASPRDVRQAVELLEENLRDDPRDFASLLEWLWAARFIPVSVDRAADLVETWASTENDRDALFYDYVVACLRVLKGQDSAIPEYQRKLERSKERSTFFGNRRFSYEWLGEGTELGRIVHHTDLRDWERSGDEPAPTFSRASPDGSARSAAPHPAPLISVGASRHSSYRSAPTCTGGSTRTAGSVPCSRSATTALRHGASGRSRSLSHPPSARSSPALRQPTRRDTRGTPCPPVRRTTCSSLTSACTATNYARDVDHTTVYG